MHKTCGNYLFDLRLKAAATDITSLAVAVQVENHPTLLPEMTYADVIALVDFSKNLITT